MFIWSRDVTFVQNFRAMAMAEIPEGLCILKVAPWPGHIKEEIIQSFAKYGQQEVLSLKLVESYALAFGGKEADGQPDLSGVHWGALTAYFDWEASAFLSDVTEHTMKETARLKRLATQKLGKALSPQTVYYPKGI